MLRFRYIAVAAPGKTNDGRDFQKFLGLRQWLAEIDLKYYIHWHPRSQLSASTIPSIQYHIEAKPFPSQEGSLDKSHVLRFKFM
jgi:hypothetical protein